MAGQISHSADKFEVRTALVAPISPLTDISLIAIGCAVQLVTSFPAFAQSVGLPGLAVTMILIGLGTFA